MKPTTIKSEVFERIDEEHVALREKLRRIHSVLAEGEIAAETIMNLLKEFHSALRIHFANEEESEGFFDEIAAQAPQLISRAERLCIEHEQLLHRAAELCRFAVAGSPSMAWWRELSCRCHDFSRALMRHESEENQLLQEAHQEDIGTKD